jgi:hypothetical protein
MRLAAYVLAADPAWLEASIGSYYDIVEKVVVSYDRDKLGWTGKPILVDECLERAKSIDKDNKMVFVPGHFAVLSNTPMENETRQRQHALAEVGDVDWVLQIDTDEIVANTSALTRRLAAQPQDYHCLSWPMRSFFQRTEQGAFLEVCKVLFRRQHDENFPIAVRPGSTLQCARYVNESTAIFRSRGWDLASLTGGDALLAPEEAMLHFSWVRSEEHILRKLRSWGHSLDFDVEGYFRKVWLAAPKEWSRFRDFHPLTPKTWPALRSVELAYRPNW